MFALAPIRLSSSFEWRVAVGGYRLQTLRIPDWLRTSEGYLGHPGEEFVNYPYRHGERIIEPARVDCSFEMRRPLENSALFLEFAHLECSESSVVQFVSRYGLLSYPAVSRRPTHTDENPYDFYRPEGESLGEWYDAIRALKLGIALWEASRNDSDEIVQQLVADPLHAGAWTSMTDAASAELRPTESDSEHSVGFRLGGTRLSRLTRLPWPQPQQVRTREDALHAAHAIALREIDASAWTFARTLPKNRYVLEVAPTTLRAGLSMQFAVAIAADSHYRRCQYEGCGGFLDADAYRKSRRYCSDSCRTRAYNQRKAKEAESRGHRHDDSGGKSRKGAE